MNRKDFLKRLGFGTMGVIVAPKVIGDIKEAPLKIEEPKKELHNKWYRRRHPYTYEDCYTSEPDWDITEDKLERAYMMQKEIDNEIFLGKTMG